nr:MAG TPA: hypothetical protein [Caudoviricetes sp.]
MRHTRVGIHTCHSTKILSFCRVLLLPNQQVRGEVRQQRLCRH